MAYIGALPQETYTALTQQTFSSPTGTSFTLSQACTNSVDIALFIDNVRQDPASYSVSGTSLTTSTIASPSTMYCIFNGRTTQTVNPPNDSVGLAQLAGATDGNLISFDASGNPAYVSTGSDGQVLTSAGAGQPCAFEALPSSLSLLSSVTISSDATVSFTGGFGGAHHHHVFIGSALVPATDAGTLTMVLSTDGGSSYASSGYEWVKHRVQDNGTTGVEVSASDSHLELTFNTAWGKITVENWNFWIHMWFPEGTGTTHYAGNGAGIESGAKTQMDQIGGSLTTAADTDAVRFLAESGAIASGKIDHYAWTD